MINLLSPELKSDLKAAHQNTKLQSYIMIAASVLIIAMLVFAAGYGLSYQQRLTAEDSLKNNQEQLADYKQIRESAESFHNNLSIAKTILSQEILFSDLIIDITKVLPSGTVLTSLILDEESIKEPLPLTARVSSPQAAVTLKNTLEKSAIFTDVNLVSVQDMSESDQSGDDDTYKSYPVSVSLQATIDKDWLNGERS